MKKMAASLLVMALLAPTLFAAPAPDRAKEKLEAMKKKLPEVVKVWSKKYDQQPKDALVEVRLVRQISPVKAKIAIFRPGIDDFGQHYTDKDDVLTIYLRFYDGNWTTTRYEAASDEWRDKHAARLLMLAIDELGDK